MSNSEMEAQVRALLHDARTVNVLALEHAEGPAVEQLVEQVVTLAQRGNYLADRLIQGTWTAHETERMAPESIRLMSPPAWHEPESTRLSDLAFITKMDLLQKQRRLSDALGGPRIVLLAECESCQRRLQKSLTAILSILDGKPPELAAVTHLQASLLVRGAYAKFRHRVNSLPPIGQNPETLHKQLRSAGTLIAILVGSDAYAYFRIADRHQVSNLQRRILEALENTTSTSLAITALNDLTTFVQLLAAVNHRQELREHDAQQIGQWLTELTKDHTSTEALALQLETYRARLYGADTQLDAIFNSVQLAPKTKLVGILEKLANRKNVTPGERPTRPETALPTADGYAPAPDLGDAR